MSYARIIATLAHIHVVIRVDGLLGAELATKNLDGTVRDDLQQDYITTPAKPSASSRTHLIGIHVALGSATSLEHDQGEVIKELACDDLNEIQQCVTAPFDG